MQYQHWLGRKSGVFCWFCLSHSPISSRSSALWMPRLLRVSITASWVYKNLEEKKVASV